MYHQGNPDDVDHCFIVRVTSGDRSWLIRRTYDNMRLLDRQLHKCIYDRSVCLSWCVCLSVCLSVMVCLSVTMYLCLGLSGAPTTTCGCSTDNYTNVSTTGQSLCHSLSVCHGLSVCHYVYVCLPVIVYVCLGVSVRRTYDNMRLLDRQLHKCIYDRSVCLSVNVRALSVWVGLSLCLCLSVLVCLSV